MGSHTKDMRAARFHPGQRRAEEPARPVALETSLLPHVVELSAPAADDARLVGAKAANLAVARRRGLPVLPGFVLTTAASAAGLTPELIAALHPQWARLSRSGTDAVIVRSSSTIEDGRTSSMAGQFSTVPDVRGWDQFLEAIDTVLASAGGLPAAGMAVLIQPQLEAAGGGVLFSVDPITGDRRHFLVEAAADGPQSVVDGSAIATRMSLTPRGRLAGSTAGPDGLVLDRSRRHRLAGLARNVTAAFGIPQDIEWAFDDRGRLWLLQARPVTTVDNGGRSPVLGPGPLADTFPAPLRRLEQDLWLPPLRRGIAQALLIVGVVPRRRIDRSPLVIAVGGRVAADLDLLGEPARHQGLLHRLDPRPPARRLRAAWRVGRLRRALPVLATDVIRQVDADLAAVPRLSQLSEEQLVNVLRRAGPVLEALHGYEVLAGMLLTPDHGGETGLSVALGTVASMRASGIPDAEIVARAPVALALIAPEVDAPNELPVVSHGPLGPGGGVDRLEPREALRLRTRWVQELTARAAAELGRSLEARRALATGGAVTDLKLAELEIVVVGGAPPADLDQRASRPGPPLPADFRLTSTGAVIPERRRGQGSGARAGSGAGGGRGVGPAHHGDDGPALPGDVLVVRNLEPTLAPRLTGLAGLVSETGSVLSHLAILAREQAVPTVVGVPDALQRFPSGAVLAVDGITGEVVVVDQEVTER